jgi:hypothetical protein
MLKRIFSKIQYPNLCDVNEKFAINNGYRYLSLKNYLPNSIATIKHRCVALLYCRTGLGKMRLLLPFLLQMNGLRRNDDAMKNQSWYYKG